MVHGYSELSIGVADAGTSVIQCLGVGRTMMSPGGMAKKKVMMGHVGHSTEADWVPVGMHSRRASRSIFVVLRERSSQEREADSR
jgi:hypothetical protein